MNHDLLLCPVLPGYDFLKLQSHSYQSINSLVCVVNLYPIMCWRLNVSFQYVSEGNEATL